MRQRFRALAGIAFFSFFWSALIGNAADVPADPNLVVLVADTHITGIANIRHQRDGFARCVKEIIALNPRPANLLLYGDISHDKGSTNDYSALRELIKPLETAGIAWHACFGNHDRREPFFAVFPEKRPVPPLVPDRLVTLVELPHADFLMLDSCLEGPVNGGLDDAQREWFEAWLKKSGKPLFVGAHHPLEETGVAAAFKANPRCKAYIFGHHHAVADKTVQGVRTFCLPSTGHWGDIGYVLVKLTADEALFTVKQHDFYAPRPAAKPEDIKPEWLERVRRNNGLQWLVNLRASGIE